MSADVILNSRASSNPTRPSAVHPSDTTDHVRIGIGRRFAITEATCFLAKLVRDWRVEILTRGGESEAQWEAKYMEGRAVTNFGIAEMPVRLVRRA